MNEHKILLNDIFRLSDADLEHAKVRLNINDRNNPEWKPAELYRRGEMKRLLDGNYFNYGNKCYKKGDKVFGFFRLPEDSDLWVLFEVGLVEDDLNVQNGMGYAHKTLEEYAPFFGRLVAEYHNPQGGTTLVRNASELFPKLEVHEILAEYFK